MPKEMPKEIRVIIERSRVAGIIVASVFALASMSACAPIITYHGSDIPQKKVQQIKVGASTRDNVRALLGSPSYVSFDKERLWIYFYKENKAWLPTFENEQARRIIGIYFNQSGNVVGKRIWNLADGHNINFVAQTIASPIPELNWVQRLFSNIGRVTPAGAPQAQGP